MEIRETSFYGAVEGGGMERKKISNGSTDTVNGLRREERKILPWLSLFFFLCSKIRLFVRMKEREVEGGKYTRI